MLIKEVTEDLTRRGFLGALGAAGAAAMAPGMAQAKAAPQAKPHVDPHSTKVQQVVGGVTVTVGPPPSF